MAARQRQPTPMLFLAQFALKEISRRDHVFQIRIEVGCARLFAMRRAQAILVIVALLATPLALLARATDSGMPDCNGMCCLPHGSHHSPLRNPSPAPQQEEMACHHGAAGHMMECSMKSGQHRMDYGLLAPYPPAKTSALASLIVPRVSRIADSHLSAGNLSAGFLASHFQPPRS